MTYNDIMNYRKTVDILTVSKAESDRLHSIVEPNLYRIQSRCLRTANSERISQR